MNDIYDKNESAFVRKVKASFHAVDYVVFFLFIAISGVVGVYFYIRGQKTTDAYFLGNRTMRPVPVGLSTGVSFLSATILVGMPAEIYIHGYSNAVASLFGSAGFLLASLGTARLLYPIGLTSLNDYFQMRFKSTMVTNVARYSVLLCIFHYMGVCMQGSIVAFTSVTGGKVGTFGALSIGWVVAIFYTSIGGLQAVVWTDTIQTGVMISGILAVIIKAITDTPGGMSEILRINYEFGHIHQLDFSSDMTVRHSALAVSMGTFISWAVWCAQPANVQRLVSVASLKDAYIVASISGGLFLLFSLLPAWAGLNIFGYYTNRGCDVYEARWIKQNEIILYFVRERLSWPGFQGLFMAALYAGSLSSLSSALNAASSIIWTDTIKPRFGDAGVSEKKAVLFSKLIVVIIGVLGMLWSYGLRSMKGMILQVAASIDASTFGTYFSIAFVGAAFGFINAKGVTAGFVVGFGITFWLGLGGVLYGKMKSYRGSFNKTVEHCLYVNRVNETQSKDEPFILYSISYLYLAPICILLTVSVAAVVSLITRHTSDEIVDPKLLFPSSGFCRNVYTYFMKLLQRLGLYRPKEKGVSGETEKPEKENITGSEEAPNFEMSWQILGEKNGREGQN